MSDEKTMYKVPNIDNPKVREYVSLFINDKTDENLTKLVNECVGQKFLVPCQINNRDGKNLPLPLTMKDDKGNIFQPIFTCPEAIRKMPRPQAVAVFDFILLADVAVKQKGNLNGIVIDPGDNTVVFNMPLLEKIIINNNNRKNAIDINNLTSPIKVEDMTDSQYAIYQRVIFEIGKLPKKFYENKASLMDKIAEQKTEAVDQIFEEAYDDIRRYPYLCDEFEVMVINISDDERIIYIKMPERDTNIGTLDGIYLYENTKESKYGYFGIMNKPVGTSMQKGIIYIGEDVKVKILGEAPEEGAEVGYITDYYKN